MNSCSDPRFISGVWAHRRDPVRYFVFSAGLVVCFVIFFLPSLFGKQVGAGDVKLAAAMGFALPDWQLVRDQCMGALVLLYTMLDTRLPLAQRLMR
ncbi:MAG: prepilin peptidase [Eubacteriales bacterium]